MSVDTVSGPLSLNSTQIMDIVMQRIKNSDRKFKRYGAINSDLKVIALLIVETQGKAKSSQTKDLQQEEKDGTKILHKQVKKDGRNNGD